jgi:hypothetical protein
MPFPEAEVAHLLAGCKRHCCVCLRWCGSRMHLHHIHPRADGGSDERALEAVGSSVVVHDGIIDGSPLGSIFTLHGDACRRSCIYTATALAMRSQAGTWGRLASLLNGKNVLVVGYSGRGDIDIAPYLRASEATFVWVVRSTHDDRVAFDFEVVSTWGPRSLRAVHIPLDRVRSVEFTHL